MQRHGPHVWLSNYVVHNTKNVQFQAQIICCGVWIYHFTLTSSDIFRLAHWPNFYHTHTNTSQTIERLLRQTRAESICSDSRTSTGFILNPLAAASAGIIVNSVCIEAWSLIKTSPFYVVPEFRPFNCLVKRSSWTLKAGTWDLAMVLSFLASSAMQRMKINCISFSRMSATNV